MDRCRPGGAGAHPGGPREYPPCVPNLDVCYHPSQKLSVYGSRNQTNNHGGGEPGAKLGEKLRRDVTEERESDDGEGTTCVASLGVATGILPFHQDPFCIHM